MLASQKRNIHYFSWLVIILIVTVSCSKNSTSAQDNNSPDSVRVWYTAKELNNRLGRGVNLGNALEAPNEGDWGVVLTSEYFHLIDSVGFDAVRIPIRWSTHAEVDSPYTIDADFFKRVDWAINQALDNHLLSVINIHHYEEIMANPAEQKTRFLSLWKQIATHYQSWNDDVIFEILNEPNNQLTTDLWNEYLRDALAVIRETNPKRTIIIGTANWGGIDGLNALELPSPDEDPYIIATFHYYNPFHFTHQGAEWVDGSDAWLGTTWTGRTQEKTAMMMDFDKVKSWSDRTGIPVYMGEFGAYSKADMDSRSKWTQFAAREAETRGFSWAYWEFCAGFGIYNPVTETWYTPLLDSLIPVNQ